MLFGQGGNIGISYGEDGMMIIDTQFANVADKVKAELARLGTDKPRFVFNTYWHGDHTGGNEIFGKDSLIIAHAMSANECWKLHFSEVSHGSLRQKPHCR